MFIGNRNNYVLARVLNTLYIHIYLGIPTVFVRTTLAFILVICA